MQVHLLPDVPSPLSRIDEFPGELESESDIVGAAAPLPVPDPRRAPAGPGPRGLYSPGLVAVVTGAGLNAALGTGASYCVSHSSAGDGVDEGGLTATWGQNKTIRYKK